MSPQADRSPAFQFYPRDWDTDSNVIPMTYEEEGVYFALCRRYWLDGTLPADLERLRRLLKGRPSLAKMQKWWDTIGPCFTQDGNSLTHKRLDRERQNQADYREAQSQAGRHGAAKRWSKGRHSDPIAEPNGGAIDPPMANHSSSSASSSASSTAVKSVERAPANVQPFRKPRSMGALGSSPAQHIGHARCNDRGVCMPQSLYTEILGRFANDVTRFDAFYESILAQMPDDFVPAGSVFRFWHDMLERAHPNLTPKVNPRTAAMEADF